MFLPPLSEHIEQDNSRFNLVESPICSSVPGSAPVVVIGRSLGGSTTSLEYSDFFPSISESPWKRCSPCFLSLSSFFVEFYVLGAVERCVFVLESPRGYR